VQSSEVPDLGGFMGAVILEKFLNHAVQSYGSEAAAVSGNVAAGISALTDPRGIPAVADAYEGYFPQAENVNKATLSGLSAEGAFPSPSQFFQKVIPSGEVSKTLNDPAFNAAKEIPSFLKNVFGKGGVPNGFAEAGSIIINYLGDPERRQSLMKMQSTLENQKSMSQELAFPAYRSLRA